MQKVKLIETKEWAKLHSNWDERKKWTLQLTSFSTLQKDEGFMHMLDVIPYGMHDDIIR